MRAQRRTGAERRAKNRTRQEEAPQETHRSAALGLDEVDDLAGLTAVFYSLSYVGFFVPAVLAAISPVIGYPTLFVAGAVIAALSAALVWRAYVNGKGRALAA